MKKLILKGLGGSLGVLILIVWKILSYIQSEYKMTSAEWILIVIVIASSIYGLYEFVSFLCRLWKYAHQHSHPIDNVKSEIETNFNTQINKIASDLRVELKTYTNQKIEEIGKTGKE